jgi:hypothetical protein
MQVMSQDRADAMDAPMQQSTKNYHSFLLRMWQTNYDGRLTWRASLEDVKTTEIHHFASMELLVKYLQDSTRLIIAENQHNPK